MRSTAMDALLVGILVLAAALFGILTRPIGFLSAFWPANALLLGVLITRPCLANPFSLLAALMSFVAADLLTGGTWNETAMLTSANMAGVIAGWVYVRHFKIDFSRLERPQAVYGLLQGAAIAALAAAFVGMPATPGMLHTDYGRGFLFWFASELVNYVLILPPVVMAPAALERAVKWIGQRNSREHWIVPLGGWKPLPALALLGSTIAAYLIGGPGALAIPVPALLWCALSYNMFVTSVLTLLLCGWEMLAVTDGLISMGADYDMLTLTTSLRCGIAMLAVTPLVLASVNTARNELLQRLDRAATHDALTGVLTRGALLTRAADLVGDCALREKGLSLIIFDVDHFKLVNDRHGHIAGDQVLVAIATRVMQSLRPDDLIGRFGGEEFVVVLPGIDGVSAEAVANRLREAVARLVIETDGGKVQATISLGVASDRGNGDLDHLLAVADRALYRAKEAGRNRVECACDQVGAPVEVAKALVA